MIPNLTCAYFFRWVCEKPPTTNPFSCCWCSASQNDFPYLEIWKEFGMASSKVSCFFSRQITLRLATFCRNHRSEMLHVWNMYLHLAHIYGKSIGKCSIHEAYADLNRPSYPRQDAFWVAPNASGRCHQWYRQFVLTSNRCNGNPMICMINICIYIYIMVWQMTWGYIERMIENSIHVVQTWKNGAQSIPIYLQFSRKLPAVRHEELEFIAELETFPGLCGEA